MFQDKTIFNLTLTARAFLGCLGTGGGGGECPRPITLKLHGIGMKFGMVLENHKLINLV